MCKKIISILIAVAIIFSFCSLTVSAEEQKNLVVFGDSISYGYGLKENTRAVYGKIVADTIGYNYKNLSFGEGETTASLLAKVKEADTQKEIKNADIILLSICGNDYFLDDNREINVLRIAKMFITWLKKDYSEIDSIATNAKKNFYAIIDTVKSVNPDVKIVLQTVYNPWYGPAGIFCGEGMARANSVITDYLKDNPGSFYLVDVATAFRTHKEYVADDSVHPSSAGNEVIAKLIVDELRNQGVTNATELVIKTKGTDYNLYIDTIPVLGETVFKVVRFLTQTRKV